MAETPDQSVVPSPASRSTLVHERLKRMVDDWTRLYKLASDERRRLHDAEWKSGEGVPSILGDLEVASTTIHGRALSFNRVKWSPAVREQVLAELRQYSPTQDLRLLQWIAASRSEYPQLVDLFERLDHTRLVLLTLIDGRDADHRKAG